jgi:hypothetical protein
LETRLHPNDVEAAHDMDNERLTDAELDAKIAALETYIRQNPHSSTLEKEQLEERKQEKQKRGGRRNQGQEEILY